MRIPSGKVDQKIFFVAVDSTDLKTRKTGLSAFTVYRSRNGGTATVYTTPTITELSAANMPGVYCLLIDEDTTIASTSDSEEMALHITCATMAPVTRVFELYRRDTTTGMTALIDANGRCDVIKVAGTTQTAGDIVADTNDIQARLPAALVGGKIDANVGTFTASSLTAAAFAADAITAAKVAADVTTEIATGVWANATRTLSAGTNIVLAKGTGITGFNDLDAPGIRAAVGLAAANLDTQLATFATAASLTAVDNNVTSVYNRIGAPVGATISADIQAIAAALGVSPTALLDLPNGIETGVTLRQAIRATLSVLAGQASGLGTTNVAFRDVNNTVDRVAATVDQWGNRSSTTLDLD